MCLLSLSIYKLVCFFCAFFSFYLFIFSILAKARDQTQGKKCQVYAKPLRHRSLSSFKRRWLRPVNRAVEKWRQEHQEFKISLSYIVRFCLKRQKRLRAGVWCGGGTHLVCTGSGLDAQPHKAVVSLFSSDEWSDTTMQMLVLNPVGNGTTSLP